MNGQRIEEEEEGQFTNGPQIFSLEMEADEEEFDSLMKETLGNATVNRVKNGRNRLNAVLSRNFNFRHRANAVIATAVAHGEGRKKNIIQGFLRSHVGNASSMRNIAMLSVLAICSFILVRALNQNMAHGPVDQIQARPHAPSLGGSLNSGHYQQQPHDDLHAVSAKNTNSIAEDDYSGYDDDYEGSAQLPQSNVGVGVLSVTSHNIENGPGHYLHDPLKSPYASPYYAVYKNNSAQLDAMQKDFERKMAAVNATYGRWETPTWSVGLTTVDFSYAHRKDVKGADFPDGAWQSNAAYVQNFLKQAKLLVARVREGIFTEYGYGTMNVTSTAKKNDIIVKRLSEFQVIVSDTLVLKDGTAVRDKKTGLKAPGIAYLNTAASEGLIRKLLHAMVTTDEFYVVSTGNVNTYASNNFAQSAVMEFNYIMEPVFDRLGVKLISRNMGMNASMAISALGGTDIYGEADIFWHIPTSPSGTPESAAVTDLLHKQAILSGERMPVILTADPVGILVATNNKAWFGNLQPGASFCEASVLQDGKTLVPAVKACRYVNCSPGSDCDKHDSVCWIERSDQNLLPGQSQDNDVGHQKEGYPSVQTQRLEGRKLAMLVLHALEEALDLWTEQSRKGSFPLPDDLWHVGPVYDELREMVRTLRSSECDYLFRKLDSNICHMEMHAYTEWTPRVNPMKRLKSLAKGPIADNHASMVEVCTGVDLLPFQWKPTDDDVDVHMIAIATDTVSLSKGQVAVKVNDVVAKSPWNDDDTGMRMQEPSANDHDHGFGDDDYTRRRHLSQRRKALTSDVSEKSWTVYNAPLGFCDGSAQSTCNRNVFNSCLLSNHNYYRAGIIAHGKSGKLSLSIPSVKEGIVLARFDWDLEGGPCVESLPADFRFEYTVNGKKNSLNRNEFTAASKDITGDLRLHALLMDHEMSQNRNETKTIDIELEVVSAVTGVMPLVLLSHIYYA